MISGLTGSTFSAVFRYPHLTGAYVSAGGLSCHYLMLTADIATGATFNNLANALTNSLHWVVPIIESTSSASLLLWLQSPNSGFTGYRGRWTASNNTYAIYPGAQVTSVMQSQKLSNTLTLEVPVTFATGDSVILPQYHNLNVYAALHSVQRVFPQTTGNPGAWWMQLAGLWTDNDTAMYVSNNTPTSIYTGGKSRPLFMHPAGNWASILYLDKNPGEVVKSDDTSIATNLMTQNSTGGYAYFQSDPVNRRWAMANYFNSAYILFDWASGNISTTGKVAASSLQTSGPIYTGVTSNTDLAGTFALMSGIGYYTFTNSYTNSPICVATDNSAAAAVRVQTTSTTLTIYGTGSDNVSYVCIARY